MQKHILYVTDSPDSATAYYRGYYPFSVLRNDQMYDFDFVMKKDPKLSDLLWADLVIMERPYNDLHKNFAYHTVLRGRYLWVDYDDLLTEIPKSNPCHKTYKKREFENIDQCLQLANVATFSTSFLRERMVGSENVQGHYVVRNSLPLTESELQGLSSLGGDNTKTKTVLWRGSPTHQKDLMAFAEQIVSVANDFPEWKFSFMGTDPWFLTDNMPHTQFLGGKPIQDYFLDLFLQKPSVVVVPLFDEDFNHAKSNIAGLEGSWIGRANVLCPDWDEWKIPGWINYKDPKEFEALLRARLEAGIDENEIDKANLFIQEKYSLAHFGPAQQTREEILRQFYIIK